MIPHRAWNQDNLPPNKFRYRTNWRKKLILEIGIPVRLYNDCYWNTEADRYEWNWRDATVKDITHGEVV